MLIKSIPIFLQYDYTKIKDDESENLKETTKKVTTLDIKENR